MKVYVEGPLRHRKYTGKDGVERTAVEVHASELIVLGEGRGGDGARAASTPTQTADVFTADAGDIPF